MIYFINTNEANIITYLVKNKGRGDVGINIEISSDNILDFISTTAAIDLFGNSTNYIIKKNFLFSKKPTKKVESIIPTFISVLASSSDDFFFIHDNKFTVPPLYIKGWENKVEFIKIDNPLNWQKNELKQWIKINEIDIEKPVLELLLSNLCDDFNAVKSELCKLSMLDNKKITTLAVNENSYLTLEGNVFLVIDLLFNKKVKKALFVYNSLLKSGTNPVAFLEIFVTQLRFYYQVSLLLEDNAPDDIAALLKTNPYRVKKSLGIIKGGNTLSLANTYIKISNIECLVKTGKLNQDLIFFQLSNSI